MFTSIAKKKLLLTVNPPLGQIETMPHILTKKQVEFKEKKE